MLGIIKNNQHSYKDFSLTIKSKKINTAKKKKITLTVPFMNGSYDFSELYGEQSYDDRDLEYTFNLEASDKVGLNIAKRKVVEWLSDGGRQVLKDDAFPGYYFMAECVAIDTSEKGNHAEIKASFDADPFMYGIHYEGHDIWDDFCFEDDYAQPTSFKVNGIETIELYNLSSISVTPTIICTNRMEILLGGVTYVFEAGVIRDYRFKLQKGNNELKIKGNGDIRFEFRKEVL